MVIKKSYLLYCLFSLFILSFKSVADNKFHQNAPRDTRNQLVTSTKENASSDSFTSTYFSNLSKYSVNNWAGSCGYVSLIQYLSFWDSYWNDNFIPESFDRGDVAENFMDALSVSPGVSKLVSYPNVGSMSNQEIFDFVDSNRYNDFQFYLMNEINKENEVFSFSISVSDYQKVFDFLGIESTFTYRRLDSNLDYYYVSSMQEDIFEDIQPLLQFNIPVVIHIMAVSPEEHTLSGYHSVVAYKVDELGIHCNFGWGEGYTDYVIPSPLSPSENADALYYITDYGYLDHWQTEVVHSNNYKVNGGAYCGCGKHTIHDIEYREESSSSNYHIGNCRDCEYSIREQHYTKKASMTGMQTCAACGARRKYMAVIM